MTTLREMTKEELADMLAKMKDDGLRIYGEHLSSHIAALEAKAEKLAGEAEILREENKRLDAACGMLSHDVTLLERERDDANTKATSARDAALEQAALAYEAWAAENCQTDSPTPDGRIRALKSQPARRFVDAAHISDVLSQVAFDTGAGRVDGGGMPVLLEIARRLGVPVDEVSP